MNSSYCYNYFKIPVVTLPSPSFSILILALSGRRSYPLYDVKTLSVMNYWILSESKFAEFSLAINNILSCSKRDGLISLATPSLKMAMVARARPTIMRRIGNRVSIPKVFLSLIYINNFFLVKAFRWSKNGFYSCCLGSEIVYSSKSPPVVSPSSSFCFYLSNLSFSTSSPCPILRNTSSRVVMPTP
jgi:hypothetical protein